MKVRTKRSLAVLVGIVLLLTQIVGIMPAQPVYAEETAGNILNVGIEEDYGTIQDAVYAAQPGDTILVSDGDYEEAVDVYTEDLVIRSVNGAVYTGVFGGSGHSFTVSAPGVVIEGFTITSDGGAGIYATTESGGQLAVVNNTICDNYEEGIYIEEANEADIAIYGNNISGSDSAAINIESAGNSSIEIRDNIVTGNYGEAVYFDYCYDSTVTIANNSLSENDYYGIYFYDVSATVLDITDNNITNNDDDGICIEYINDDDDETHSGGSTVTIEGNTVAYNDCEGIYIDEMNDTGLSINDNTIYGNSCEGIYLDYLYNGNIVNIEGNTIYGHEWDEGIYVYELGYEAGDSNELNILNNYVGVPQGGDPESDANEDGIYVSDVDYDAEVIIEGNTVTGNTGDGMILEYMGTDGYEIWDDATNTIDPEYVAPSVVVRNNIITGNDSDGLYQYDDWMYGASVVIEDNVISDNTECGIYHGYDDISHGAVVIERNNEITGNGYGGIFWGSWNYISDYAEYTITGNNITGNSDYGILINGTDEASVVEIGPNNTVSNNEGFGICLEDEVTGVRVWGNIIEGNYEGLGVAGYSNEITGNEILSNLYDESGIHLDPEAAGNTINHNDIAGNGSGISSGSLDDIIDVPDLEARSILPEEKAETTCSHKEDTAKKTKDTGDSLISIRDVSSRTDSEEEPNNATLNWWGNSSGPTVESNVYGSGDSIVEGIPYSPWAAAAYFQEETVELNPGDSVELTLFANTMGTAGETGTVAVPPYTVRYTSSDTGVATVASDGTVNAVGTGSAEITAHFAGAPTIGVIVNSPPEIVSTTPEDGASGVAVNGPVVFNFSESIFEGPGIGSISITAGETVLSYTYLIEDNSLQLIPESRLAYRTQYTVALPVDSITDSKGLGLDEEYSLTFTTRSRPRSGSSSRDTEDTIVIPPIAGPVSPFRDVPDDHWAVNEVVYLYENQIINGFSGNIFMPDRSITRAELAAMLAKALRLDSGSASAEQQFSDVSRDHWAFSAVAAATEAGLMIGYSSGEFRPDAPIVREELALVMMRALSYPQEIAAGTTENLDRFNDKSQIPGWSAAAISQAIETGLIQGISENSFGAGMYATRAQVAVMTYRMLGQRAGNR